MQIDIELPNMQTFYGSFDVEGLHFVEAIVDSQAGGEWANPKVVQVPIHVSQPKSVTALSTDSLSPTVSGILIYVNRASGKETGCGVYYNVFDTASKLTFMADVVQGPFEKVRWRIIECSTTYPLYTFEASGPSTNLTVSFLAGVYMAGATAIGPHGESLEAFRTFELKDYDDYQDACRNFPLKEGTELSNLQVFPNVWTQSPKFKIFNQPGPYHFLKLENNTICLSPEVISATEIPSFVTANITAFIAKLHSMEDNTTFVMQGEMRDICLSKEQLHANQLYQAALYGSNGQYLSREEHVILTGEEIRTNVIIEVIRPLSSAENSVLSSAEHVVLSCIRDGIICHRDKLSQWELRVIYSNGSIWFLSTNEMEIFTEGWISSTLVIQPEFLLQLPENSQLVVCISVDSTRSAVKNCTTLSVEMPEKCEFCYLEAPDMIDDFQKICIHCDCQFYPNATYELYVTEGSSSQTLGYGSEPSFCSLLPASGDAVTPCIRSLPGTDAYIDMCFRQIKFKPKSPSEVETQIDDLLTGHNGILEDAVQSKNACWISEVVQVISAQISKFADYNFNQSTQNALNSKRNKVEHLVARLVDAIVAIDFYEKETVLVFSSALEVIAAHSKYMQFQVTNQLQTKVASSIGILNTFLAASTRADVLLISERFMKFGLLMIEGMSQQHEDPSAALKDRDPKTILYETDIDSTVVGNEDLIIQSIHDDQRKSAKSMVAVLEDINAVLANALHNVLISGGSALEVTSDTSGWTSFCRTGSNTLESDLMSCSTLKTSISSLSIELTQTDVLIRTSYFTNNVYNFFDLEDTAPRSDILSLSIYSHGEPVNTSNTNSSFRIILRKTLDESENENTDAHLTEEELQLPEPIVAVDGSMVCQPFIMGTFEINDDDATFIFQLYPSNIAACAQYLIVARFIIPPNFIQADEYGEPFWTMLPSSTSKCNMSGNADAMLVNYALYLYSPELKKLKSDAFYRTGHMRLKAQELKQLYIGYRQLSVDEIDRYDERNPPPIPYPFTGQINVTALASASMPSCLHFAAGDDCWRASECRVLPWPNREEVLCECLL